MGGMWTCYAHKEGGAKKLHPAKNDKRKQKNNRKKESQIMTTKAMPQEEKQVKKMQSNTNKKKKEKDEKWEPEKLQTANKRKRDQKTPTLNTNLLNYHSTRTHPPLNTNQN